MGTSKKQKSNCLFCRSEVLYNPSVQSGKYCSNKCQMRFQRLEKIDNGTAGWQCLKTYIKDLADGKCQICGTEEWLSLPIMLICDHIDGNSENNQIHNLRAICSNCDATLPTYKSRNNGNGRTYRRKIHAAEALR